MKVILQNPDTQLYCLNHRDCSTWTSDEEMACDFKSSLGAVHFCTHHHMPDTRVILKFGGRRRYDINLMITGDHFSPNWQN
jgi:hypothetical protein